MSKISELTNEQLLDYRKKINQELARRKNESANPNQTDDDSLTSTNWLTINPRKLVPLSKDWELPRDWGEAAEELGYSFEQITRQEALFKQYWLLEGTRRTAKGWRKTFTNWMENARKRNSL